MADHERPDARQRQLPFIWTAASRHQVLSVSTRRHAIGCLYLFAAAAVPGALFLATKIGTFATLVVGIVALVFGFTGYLHIYFKVHTKEGPGEHRESSSSGLFKATGFAAVLSAALRFLGLGATWVPWTAATLLMVLGIILLHSARPGVLRRYLDEQRLRLAEKHAGRSGCRIAFFRPFGNRRLSTLAKNHLVPVLNGYGTVFFVTDETYDAAKSNSRFAREYSERPQSIQGHPRFDEEWQRRVLEELNEADIAVVDVSVPSVNVLWEIKQCYDLLPAHRVIFVGNADEILDASTVREFYHIFYSLPVTFTNNPGFVERVHAKLNASMEGHLKSLMDGLMSFEDFNRHNGPPCLAHYFTDKAGRQWLEAALHGFMSRIIEIETTERHGQEGTVHVRPVSAVAAAVARFGGGHPPADLQSSAPARVALSKLQVGDRVLHNFLGQGVVESVENESTGDLKVAFLGRPAPYSMNTTYLTLIDR